MLDSLHRNHSISDNIIITDKHFICLVTKIFSLVFMMTSHDLKPDTIQRLIPNCIDT